MKKLILPLIAAVTAIGLLAAAPSSQVVTGITTTSSAVFVPLGYNRLTCSGDVYYKVVSSSSGTAATTDSLAKGPLAVNGVTVARPTWINVTSDQWLALLNRSGVNQSCTIEQVSVDGVAGTFTTVTISSTLGVTGAVTLAGNIISSADAGFNNLTVNGTTTHTGATTMTGNLTSTADAGFNNFTVNGAATVTGATTLTGDVAATTTKNKGSITLNGASPSVITATVASGSKCVCSNEDTTTNDVKCKVSSTTLTVTGPNGATDVVSYICL